MRSFIRSAAVTLVAILLSIDATAAAGAPTNLVVIMTDDQGAWSLGCYGNKEASTPTIDRLAEESVRFTQAFATSPVCSPSRATFFTGRIPSQHGIHDWIKHENIGPRARYCLEHEVTLSDILSRHGYTCGISGKWHLGNTMKPQAGFSFWYVLPKGSSSYQNAEMIWQKEMIETEGYITDRVTDKALEFMTSTANEPFYLEVQYNAPHGPWKGHPPELLKRFDACPFASIPEQPLHPWAAVSFNHIGNRDSLQQYFAACSGIDRGVSRIVDHLQKLDLEESTLVVFTSDQGFNAGHHGLWGKGNASNPRNAYDTSLRIPMIFRHTEHLASGRTIDAPISAYDFLPTILAYLGLPPSPGRNLPGHSFAPMLKGRQQEWTDTVYAEYGHLRAIRTPDYKYIHRANGGPLELYDLREDPDELVNVAEKPENDELREQLRKRLFAWFDKYVEADGDPIGHEYLWGKRRR